MKANETHLARLVEGTHQYLIPHFQRPYTWEKSHWTTLWEDVREVSGLADPEIVAGPARQHFLGSIVTMPGTSVPEGITKFLLIDGQQRLTTLLLLLAAIRDQALELKDVKLSGQIQDLYLQNRYQEGEEAHKLLPTRSKEADVDDRAAFLSIIERSEGDPVAGKMQAALVYFRRQIRLLTVEKLQVLVRAVMTRLVLVSIVLEKDDNPYAIFESLNAKGQPLSQADLIRNFFFMSIDSQRHEVVYLEKWVPMERDLGQDNMTEFIRHFLMQDDGFIKQADVSLLSKIIPG